MANAVVDVRKIFSDDPILLLSKLGWEISEIQSRSQAGCAERIFLSLNAAHSAWHLHQWVWELSSEQSKDRLVAAFGLTRRTAKAFGMACRERSGAIDVCREISVAGKHVAVEHSRDHISAKVLHDPEKAEHAYTVMLTFGDQEFEDTFIYMEAIKFWQMVYIQLGFGKSAELLGIISDLATKQTGGLGSS